MYIQYDDDAENADSHKVSFHVRFDEAGRVDDVYALETEHGNEIGQRGDLETKADTPENVHGSVLWVGNIGVAFADMGEGHDGDYNPEDPDDEPLLRLDFMQMDEDGNYLDIDGSGCTQVNADKATMDQRQCFLEMAMAYAQEHVVRGDRSFKRLVGALTWQDQDWDGKLGFGFDMPKSIPGILAKYASKPKAGLPLHVPGASVPIPDLDRNYVIYSPNEAALQFGDGFWSNKDGWGSIETATIFTEAERDTLNLPVSTGEDARWLTLRAAHQDDDRYIRVEYDTAYTGGDYDNVGSFVLVPLNLVEAGYSAGPDDSAVAWAFAKVTGLDPIHIIHYSLDETYDRHGNLVE